jgi:hypothetical protein
MLTRIRLWLLILLALLSSICRAQQVVEFADGQVQAVLPSDFRIVSRPPQSLIGTFGPESDNQLKLVFITRTSGAEDIGERFIREMNQGRGKLVLESPGKVAFLMPAEEAKPDETTRTIRWQVGFGRSVVVIYLNVPSAQPMSQALKEFLDNSLNTLIASLRRAA